MKRPSTSSVIWTCAIVMAAGLIFLLVFFTPQIVGWRVKSHPPTTGDGLFGDQYGMTNAIISGLAFAGLIVAIFLQKADLKHQMNELQESQALVQRQIFEGTFFQMLRLREEVRDAVECHGDKGRMAIKSLMSGAYSAINRTKNLNEQDMLKRRSQCRKEYMEWYGEQEIQSALGHYFRLTYHCIKHVHDAPGLTDKERYAYVRLLRAHLSNDELKLLYANCAFGEGWQSFMPLANVYNLFENALLIHEHDGLRCNIDLAYTTSRVHDVEYKPGEARDIYGNAAWIATQELPKPGQGMGTSGTFVPYGGPYTDD